MTRTFQRAKSGVTLVETLLAGAILALTSLTLFEGIGMCTRIAHENAQFLVADAYAHDLAWKRFNEDYIQLKTLLGKQDTVNFNETISSNAAPTLWSSSSPAKSCTTLSRPKAENGTIDPNGLLISVDVEWGPSNSRRTLSSSAHSISIYKSGIGREDG